jgi:crotonobetainyl-CoA:carnitine CoA-transferase CaiB-like acyl-CoA transferase
MPVQKSADKNTSADAKLAPGPLDGVRVLDFTMFLSGPYGTRLLADMGAEVIKIEPLTGDQLGRARRPLRDGYSTVFGHLNAGKKSMLLDLKSDAGRKAALDLAAVADVIVENWRPGVADKLGVGYEAVSAINPGIVYCSISGFGQEGPWSQRAAYAAIVQASSGFDVAQMAYQHAEVPAKTGIFIGDVLGGLSAFAAIQGALYRRARLGKGQYIDVSLLDGMFNVMVHEVQEAQHPLGTHGRLYRPLKTRDAFIVIAPSSPKNFRDMCACVGHPEWVDDERFSGAKALESNWDQLMNLVEDWTGSRTAEECERIFVDAGVPCAPYRSTAEAMRHPHTLARGSFATVEDPAGSYQVPNAPFRMPGLDTSVRKSVPGFGDSTADLLRDLLGYDQRQIDACMAKPKV